MLVLCRPGGSAAKPCLPRTAYDEGAQPRITLTQFHYVVLRLRQNYILFLSVFFSPPPLSLSS